MAESSGRQVHEALFFGSWRELRDESAPFLREGLAAGADAVLACTEAHNRLLSEALGDDERLIRLPREQVFRKPVAAIEVIRGLLQDRVAAGSPQVRVVSEVDYGGTSRSLEEWGRFEAVVNLALAPYPVWVLCAYDLDALPAPAVTFGRLTHPFVRRAGRRRANPEYVEPAELLRRPEVPPGPLPDDAPTVAEADVQDLRGLARRVRDALLAGSVRDAVVDDLLLSLNEIVTNGLRHGTPPVSVRLWLTEDEVVCTVTDRGPGIADPLAGYLPGGGEALPEGRFGLWLARRLCDQVHTSRSDTGFTVRLVLRR